MNFLPFSRDGKKAPSGRGVRMDGGGRRRMFRTVKIASSHIGRRGGRYQQRHERAREENDSICSHSSRFSISAHTRIGASRSYSNGCLASWLFRKEWLGFCSQDEARLRSWDPKETTKPKSSSRRNHLFTYFTCRNGGLLCVALSLAERTNRRFSCESS